MKSIYSVTGFCVGVLGGIEFFGVDFLVFLHLQLLPFLLKFPLREAGSFKK